MFTFCSATSFGLRSARLASSASISASLPRAFSIRSWVWRSPSARAAWVRLGTRRRVRIDLGFQSGDTRPRCRLRLVQTQRALVRALARRSFDFGAVDDNLICVKQSLRHERCQRFGEQIVEHIGMRHAEVRKPMVVDRHAARDPAIGQILAGRNRSSSRADPTRPSSPKATAQTAQLGPQQADRPCPHALQFCRKAPSNPASRRTPPPIAHGGPAPASLPD